MNLTNCQKNLTNQTRAKTYKDNASSRSTDFSFAREQEDQRNLDGKNYTPTARVFKSPISSSFSYNKDMSPARKAPSLIPRSKSRRRTEKENYQYQRSLEGGQLRDFKKKMEEKLHLEKVKKEGESSSSEDEECLTTKDLDTFSLSLKSCDNFDTQTNVSDSSYKDASEQLSEDLKFYENEFRHQHIEQEKTDEQVEGEKQEKVINYMYDTIKCTNGPLFENSTESETLQKNKPDSRGGKEAPTKEQISEVKNSNEKPTTFANIQEYYEYTMKEISDIWKNALTLIGSVKDHTIKYVEEKSKKVDKEQLTLEAEMLQLAVDFAITYSKLKTDFLLKAVRKRLGVKETEKSELENFMDSKTFAALYNDEDLATMSQTVKELNHSILKDEDIELD